MTPEDRQFNGTGQRIGACDFCGEDAFVKVLIRKGTSAKVKNVRLARQAPVCPMHAERFWKEGADLA